MIYLLTGANTNECWSATYKYIESSKLLRTLDYRIKSHRMNVKSTVKTGSRSNGDHATPLSKLMKSRLRKNLKKVPYKNSNEVFAQMFRDYKCRRCLLRDSKHPRTIKNGTTEERITLGKRREAAEKDFVYTSFQEDESLFSSSTTINSTDSSCGSSDDSSAMSSLTFESAIVQQTVTNFIQRFSCCHAYHRGEDWISHYHYLSLYLLHL